MACGGCGIGGGAGRVCCSAGGAFRRSAELPGGWRLSRRKTRGPLTIEQIIQRSRTGEAPAALIEDIRRTGTRLAVTPEERARLADPGVAPAVLDRLAAAQARRAAGSGHRRQGACRHRPDRAADRARPKRSAAVALLWPGGTLLLFAPTPDPMWPLRLGPLGAVVTAAASGGACRSAAEGCCSGCLTLILEQRELTVVSPRRPEGRGDQLDGGCR